MMKQTHTFTAYFGFACVGFDGLGTSDSHSYNVPEAGGGIKDHFNVTTDFFMRLYLTP